MNPVMAAILSGHDRTMKQSGVALDPRKVGASKDALFKDLTILRRVLSWSRQSGYTVDASAWTMKKPKVVRQVHRQFDPDLAEKFLNAAIGRDRAIIEVDLGTGMRRDELRAFHTSWIRWDEGIIRLPSHAEFDPKDSVARSIPLFPRLERVLREWLGDRRTGLVFPPLRTGASGTGTSRGAYLIGIFRRLRKASGVPFRGWHDLRHHYISLLFKLRVPDTDIMQITGIDDMKTLKRYAHANPDHLKEARMALQGANWPGASRGQGRSGRTVTETVTGGSRKSKKAGQRKAR